METAFGLGDPYAHTTDDTIKHLSFDHMIQHARLTVAFAYELAFTDFAALEGAKKEEVYRHDSL